MKLFYKSGACSFAAHLVLEWIGQPYEAVAVQLRPASPELLQLSPTGTVPVLVVDGKPLTQNVAILSYLAEKFSEVGLCGDGSLATRTEINKWLGLINSDLHPLFGPLYGSTAFLEDPKAIEATKAMAKERIVKKLGEIDAALAGKDWLAGHRSVADAYLVTALNWAVWGELDIAHLANINAFYQRMQQDAGVQAVLKAEGLV